MTMRRILLASWIGALALLPTLASPRVAAAVGLTAGSGSGRAGQTVDIAITTTELTGQGVYAFQFELTYNANLVTATDVPVTGTLVADSGWSVPTFRVSRSGATGRIAISAAGSKPLGGAGTLLKVRFVIDPAQLTAASTALTFGSPLLNEGTPSVTTANGTLTITATPVITVSPNSAEMVRGDSLTMGVSGSVSAPVTWATTDAAVASITAAGKFKGLAAGSVRVFAVDQAGVRDTSNGAFVVRAMRLTVVADTVEAGGATDVTIRVSSLDGLAIRSGEFTLGFDAARLTATAVGTPAGCLLHDFGPVAFSADAGACRVAFSGSGMLAGSGALCTIRFVSTGAAGSTTVTPTGGVFDESWIPKLEAGTVLVRSLATLAVAPDNVTLLAGRTQQFTVSGGAVAPVTWSVLDTTLASISASGLLTARQGGVTRVRVVDAVGATDLNTAVAIADLRVALDTVNAVPGGVVRVPLDVDRALKPFTVRALEYQVSWSSAWIAAARALPIGAVYVWGEPGIVTHADAQSIRIAAAGTAALDFAGPELQVLEFTLKPGTPAGTDIALTLGGLLLNEGAPVAQAGNGRIQVRVPTGVEDEIPAAVALAPAAPSPMRDHTRIGFTLPRAVGDGKVRLVVYGVDGRRVRTLLDTAFPPGLHEVVWDGTDDTGHAVAAGLYFYRLDWPGGTLARRLVVVR